MRSNIRISLLALVAGAIVAVLAPAAAQAASPGFGVESFFAGNCKTGFEGCNKVASPAPEPKGKEEEVEKAEEEGFTQAAGHQPFGVTEFVVKNHVEPKGGLEPNALVNHVRVDVAPGGSTNPEAVSKCTAKEFGEEFAPGSGAFPTTECSKNSEIGINKVVVALRQTAEKVVDLELTGKVYNLVQPHGLSSEFGVALEVPEFLSKIIYAGTPLENVTPMFFHTLIEGGIEYATDYHDFFEIKVSEALPLLSSRLNFKGNIGIGGFLASPTSCTGIGPQTTTTVTLEDKAGEKETKGFESAIGGTGCNLIPFAPAFSLEPETTASDAPDGITLKASLPHDPNPANPDSSDLKTAVVTMPPGMTMNPSAGFGLEGCTPEQIGIGTRNETKCPAGSRIGTVTLEVPGLPAESLKGFMFLGKPASGPITGPPYTVYFDAESAKYNIKTRLKTTVEPNPATGQITATFAENPEQPFSGVTIHFNGGAFAPLGNPLECIGASTSTAFAPFSGTATQTLASAFTVEGCASSPPPFIWSQSTSAQPPAGGANSEFAFNLSRNEGQQYLASTKVVLPPGLVGKIPAVTQCTEAQVKADEAQNVAAGCPLSSKIGTVTATAGSGTPFQFTGNAYLTAPLKGEGAPYDLLSVVPIVAGPVNLGYEVTRSKIEVDPKTARVIVTTPKIPTIRGGIPTRLRSLSFNINAQNYIINPTNCGLLQTESTLTSTLGATQNVSSPFQVEGCSSLAFKPTFKATTFGHPSKANGASLETTINQPSGQANLKSVVVSLPKQLPSRLTTLQKACPEATFAANPYSCPVGSLVGGARANTPTLPGKMTGPAYLVSHGGAAFPDLDLVLEANGVRVIVTGNTDIKKGITTTSFLTNPDVPVSSITVNLPIGPHSALAANGNFCASTLVMPTTITGQNGKQVKQNTRIGVSGCGVRIVGHKVVGNTAFLTVQTFAAGRISGSGRNLATVFRSLGSAAKTAALKVPLTRAGRSRHRPLKTRVRVGFVPRQRGAGSSAAFVNLTFR